MDNLQKYQDAFKTSLEIGDRIINDALSYESIPEWDSVGHMRLMAAIEEVFDIMLETEDILDFSSFGKGKEILKKYDVDF